MKPEIINEVHTCRGTTAVSIVHVPTRDELASALRAHAEEVAAGEWRPLADHVQGIIRACLQGHGVEPKREE